MGRMEGGYRSPSIMWMMPLDAKILVLVKWTSFSPSRIWPWGRRRSRRRLWSTAQNFQSIEEKCGNLVYDHLLCLPLWYWQLGWPLCGYGEGWPGHQLTAEDKEWKLRSNLFFHPKFTLFLLCTFFLFRCTMTNLLKKKRFLFYSLYHLKFSCVFAFSKLLVLRGTINK